VRHQHYYKRLICWVQYCHRNQGAVFVYVCNAGEHLPLTRNIVLFVQGTDGRTQTVPPLICGGGPFIVVMMMWYDCLHLSVRACAVVRWKRCRRVRDISAAYKSWWRTQFLWSSRYATRPFAGVGQLPFHRYFFTRIQLLLPASCLLWVSFC